uniref:Uncharacterized protein n=1 Tax=Populus trichocarpa TaxID=3694 RepID=A0A3N7GBR9_POPTR
MSYLSKCVKDFETAQAFSASFKISCNLCCVKYKLSFFFLSILAYLPLEGSSKYMMRGFTPFPNLHVHGWRLDYNAARIMVTGKILCDRTRSCQSGGRLSWRRKICLNNSSQGR